MVAAGERPDVAVKVRKELDDDGIGGLRDEVALSDFEFVFLERTRFGKELVASAGGENEKVRGVPFSINTIAGLFVCRLHGNDVRVVDGATSFTSAVKQQAIQHGARIDDDGMGHVERGALLVAGDEFDRVDEFLGIGVVEKERETLNGF